MPLDFDYDAARNAGYSDDDILSGLAQHGKLDFDLAAARKAGYSSSDILGTLTASPPPKPEGSNIGRGFKEAFQQLPQLGYGLVAGTGAALESAVGEGGIATGIKKAGVKGYQEWGDKIAKDSKESDSFTYSYDRAKEGDFGAMVDWLAHGIGYAGGQGVQMLATAGVGSLVGKAGLKVAAEKVASGMVAKEVARLAEAEGGNIAADQLTRQAVSNVAGKLGETAAIGSMSFGQEGGEIFGDLSSQSDKENRSLSGAELARAFGATLAAGGMEFVGDKLGIDLMLGKSPLLKPASGMAGMKGRVARGTIAAAGAAPIEGATEYGQTLLEEYGKGNDPFSEESLHQAKEAAALGVLGGATMGAAGGAMHAAQPHATVEDIAKAGSIDEAIAATQAVIDTPIAISPDLRRSSYEDQDAIDTLARAAESGAMASSRQDQSSILTPDQFAQQDRIAAASAQTGAPSGIVLPEEARAPQPLQSVTSSLLDAQLAARRKRDNGELLTSIETAMADMPLSEQNPGAKVVVGPTSRARGQTAIQENANVQQSPAVDLPAIDERTGSVETGAPVLADVAAGRATDAQLPAEQPGYTGIAAPAVGEDVPAASTAAYRQPALTGVQTNVARIREMRAQRLAAESVATPATTAEPKIVGRYTKAEPAYTFADRMNVEDSQNSYKVIERGGKNFSWFVVQKSPKISAAKPQVATAAPMRQPAQVDAGIATSVKTDRRQDVSMRRKVDEMSQDEMRRALLTSELTGIPNKRAFEERVQANPNDHVLYGDLDDFKALNTKYGHEGADQILRGVGAIKAEIAKRMGVAAYHRSGDEFLATHADDAKLKAYGKSVQEALAGATFEITKPDGTVVEHKNVGFSYGTGKDVKLAESKSDEQKAERKRLGLRVGTRSDVPVAQPGREDNQSDTGGRDRDTSGAEEVKSSATEDQNDSAKFFQQGDFQQPELFKNKTTANLYRDKNRIDGVAVEKDGGWLFEPAPRALTNAEKAVAADDVRELNKALRAQGVSAVLPLTKIPTANHALAKQLGKVFGTQVHFVTNNGAFEGVAHRGVAYLTENLKRPELAIAGHEVYHTLEQSSPELAEGLLEHVRAYLKEDAIPDRKLREELMAGRPISERYAAGEVLADINGAMWLDSKFWRELIQRDANLFRRVAYLFMEKATQAVESLTGTRFDVSALVTDVDAVRKLIAQTWAEHNQSRDNSSAAADSVTMSRTRNVIKDLAQYDEIFRLPRSDKTTLEGVVGDDDPRIKVKKLGQVPGEVARYQFTLPDGATARMVVRRPSSIYGFETVDGDMHVTDERLPGDNHEAAEGKEEVYIDVSLLDPAKGYGASIYNIAANYAHNTGRIFIGDPAGLSDEAMFRRSQQMLSSALKFGTTEHLAPHPRQLKGDKELGIPALKWTHGDADGNIRNLIDVTLQSIDNNGGNGDISYNIKTGKFEDTNGNELTRDDITGMAGVGLGRAAQAGGATLARHALLSSLVQGEGGQVRGSNGILESLVEQLRQFSSTDGKDPFKDIFYSRGDSVKQAEQESGKAAFVGGLSVTEDGVKFSRDDQVGSAFDMLKNAQNLGGTTKALKSLAESDRKFNLWDRTVGTQFNKATKDADFKRVFDAYNQQTNDVAHYAIEAERQAPDVLQRLESVKDIGKALMSGGKRHKADLEAVSKALFANIEGKEGVQQKVFTDEELKNDFGLNDKQILMYKQARHAVNTSLDRLAQTTIASMGESAGMDIDSLRNMDLNSTAEAVKDHVGKDSAIYDNVDEIVDRTKELKESGYMPAMRFGEYAVTVWGKDKTDGPLHFEMFESQLAANLAAKRMEKAYPDAKVEKSVLNKEMFSMFKGVSPETVELFAKYSGMDQSEAYKDYIALAKSSRSSMQRMINRKGTAGFSDDVPRVLASFLTSNARQASMNMNMGQINEALASDSLAKKGDVQREAQKLHEYMSNPQEEAQRLRGFMFMHFLGGSVASAAVNLTQPVLQTAPYLSQFAGARVAGIMTRAAKMAATGNISNESLRKASERAAEEGLTEPQEIHQLMADASGSTLGSGLRARALTKAWGGFFSISEAYNRRLTFLAAYQTAQQMSNAELKKAGFDNAYDFAARAIIETQGLYSKTNRPNWARGAVGATLFTFKQFSISYLEFLNRLPKKQKAIALGVLILAAGLQGLPFAEDIEDLIDTLGQSLGYNTNSKKALRDTVKDIFGDDLGDVLTYGLSAKSGIDLHGRLGTSNLIPGTGLFKMSNKDKSRDMAEFAGALGGVLTQFQTAIGKAQSGDIMGKSGALASMAPVAIKNALQGAEMAQTGEYRDTRGRKVQDVDLIDSLVKTLGFQPQQIAAESRRIQAIQQDKGMMDAVKAAITERWADGIAEKDQEAISKAREALKDWNEKNPDTIIVIRPSTILTKVRDMRLSKAERYAKSVPKSMRARVRSELED